MPDISKWKTQNFKETYSLFSDCLSLLFIPDISKWNNYNSDHLNDIPDYNLINNAININSDFHKEVSNPESYDMINDTDYEQQLKYWIN